MKKGAEKRKNLGKTAQRGVKNGALNGRKWRRNGAKMAGNGAPLRAKRGAKRGVYGTARNRLGALEHTGQDRGDFRAWAKTSRIDRLRRPRGKANQHAANKASGGAGLAAGPLAAVA